MADKAKKTTTTPKKKRVILNKEDILEILEDVKESYMAGGCRNYYIQRMLDLKGLYKQKLHYWTNTKKDEDIVKLFDELKQLQYNRIVNDLLNKHSELNTTGAIFYLKCKKGWIPEEIRLRIEADKDISEENIKAINIGWADKAEDVTIDEDE